MRIKALLLICFYMLSLRSQSQLERIGTPVSWSQSLIVNPDNESLAQADVETLLGEDALVDEDRSAPYRFAYARMVNWNLENSGTWLNLPNGDRLWMLGIEYNQAQSIAITLEHVNLPKGGKLYVYSEDHQDYLGPITDEDNRAGELGLPHINGAKIYAEYYEPKAFRGQSSFTITHVAGSYRNQMMELAGSGSCLELMNMSQTHPALRNSSASVIRVLLDHGQRYATGVLVNNSSNDGTPYVLLSSNSLVGNPASYVFQFDVIGTGCTNASSTCELRTICGATVKMNDANTDAALLQLTKQPRTDWGTFYSGWRIDGESSDDYFCIQHAKGLPQSLTSYGGSFMPVLHDGFWMQGLASLTAGQTAAGSLGAPLFDGEGNLIGMFKGGSAHCGGNGGIDRFVLLDEIWNNVQSFLDPDNIDHQKLPGYYQPASREAPEGDAAFLVYPNPASDKVSFGLSADESIQRVMLFNTTGQCIKTWGSVRAIDVSDLPDGIYQLHVSCAHSHYMSPLFIAKRP